MNCMVIILLYKDKCHLTKVEGRSESIKLRAAAAAAAAGVVQLHPNVPSPSSTHRLYSVHILHHCI